MPRPCCRRQIGFVPGVTYFKPADVPLREIEEAVLALDEVEALRLADLNGLYQEEAAEKMKISRPTFSRIIEGARRKVADALIHGKALRMEGGAVIVKGENHMPGRDGRGPAGMGRGVGRGPRGCGRGRGWGKGRCMRRGPSVGASQAGDRQAAEKEAQAS